MTQEPRTPMTADQPTPASILSALEQEMRAYATTMPELSACKRIAAWADRLASLSGPSPEGLRALVEKKRDQAQVARDLGNKHHDLYAKGYGDALAKDADELSAYLSGSIPPQDGG